MFLVVDFVIVVVLEEIANLFFKSLLSSKSDNGVVSKAYNSVNMNRNTYFLNRPIIIHDTLLMLICVVLVVVADWWCWLLT